MGRPPAAIAVLISACGGSSNSGVLGQSFNLSGYWTGELISFNASKKRKLNFGLSDNSGEVTGTAVIHDSQCAPGATLAGTFVGAADQQRRQSTDRRPGKQSSRHGQIGDDRGHQQWGIFGYRDNGGSGYTSAPNAKFVRPDDPDGIRATGVTVISGGEVIGVVVTRSGTPLRLELPFLAVRLGRNSDGNPGRRRQHHHADPDRYLHNPLRHV